MEEENMRKFKRILSLLLSVIVLIPLITVSPMAQTAEVTYSASASENDTLAPENAFDGDPTTRWASDEGLVSGENYKWLQASYTTPQTINQVVIDWERANVNAYDIQVKTGDGEWITIYESTEHHESLLHTIDLGAAIVFTDLKVVIKDFFAKAVDRKGDEVDWPTVSIVELSLNHNVEETPVEPEIPSDPVDNATEPEVEAPVVDATTIYVGQQDENLALNKVVTGSDLETNTQFTKEKIVDGKKGPSKPLATYYASNENDKPIQITIDLGQLTEVESAIIFWERTVENQNITAFKLSGSADNATYTELYSQNTLVDVMNQYINFEVQNIQFLRLDITEFDGGALQWVNVGIDEIEVYSHPVSEPVEAYVGAMGENLALNVPVTGTAHEPGTQFVKENMVDGNKSTRYSSDQNVKPITFTFDLRKLTLLENVVIEWEREANAQNIIAFTLEGSIDNETFETLHTQTQKQNIKRQIIDLDALETRYLKLTITNYDGGTIAWANVGISEFEAYSHDAPEGVVSSLDQITYLTVNDAYDAVVFPELIEGATLEIVGANMPQLVDLEGNVTRPLVNKTAYVTLKLTINGVSTQKEVTVPLVGKYDNAGTNPAPIVIPDIQEWHGGEGYVAITSLNMSGDFPKAQSIYKADLESKGISGSTGLNIRFVQALDKGYHKEGYAITITDSEIVIEAETETGALYATRTLLHIGEENVPVGELRDYPRFAVRGFMLDTGRRFVPLHMVKKFMQTMVYYKLNDFQLHLNDNYIWLGDHGNDLDYVMNTAETGFRLESDIVGDNGVALTSEDHYTIAEFKELKDLAKELEITLVPEFDTPGHALSFVKVRPELMYKGSVGGKHDAERVAMLDLTNPETLPFIKEVYEDMFEKHLFDLDIVHMGSDEFYGDKESYRKYVDDMLKYLRDEKGVTPRFWGSLSNKNGTTPVTSEGTQMNVWSRSWNTEQQALAEGYDIINILDTTNMTPESVEALNTELEKAQALLANPEATQEEVDAQVQVLQSALDRLRNSEPEVTLITLVDEPTGLTATFLSTAFDSLPELVVEVTGEHAYDISFKIDGLSV